MPKTKTQINFTETNIKSPCKECTERHTGCHIRCVKYAEYKQSLEKQKQHIQAVKKQEVEYAEYIANRGKRLKGGKK